MITCIQRKRTTLAYRAFSTFIATTFIFSSLVPPPNLQAQILPSVQGGILNLPAPGTMVTVSPAFNPAIIKGVTLYPDDPLRFNFIVDTGDKNIKGEELREESRRLVKYFLAALTIPEEEMWVNLSPYEKDRIIPQGFGDTEMGRDLLAQDYLLKQLTSSLMYPEDGLGKEFWDRVYAKAREEYGTTEIPINTFNKIWVVPQKADVYVYENSAFVVNAHLKVMLEEDYLALENNTVGARRAVPVRDGRSPVQEQKIISGISSDIIREILIPEIEKEVNESKTFANLRQMYNSMILATWYKMSLKDSLLGRVYVDKNKTKGVDTKDKQINQKIYDQYIEAFKKGVYDYIKEDFDPVTQQVVPRKYFSGGVSMSSSPINFGFGSGLKGIVFASLITAGGYMTWDVYESAQYSGEAHEIEVVLKEEMGDENAAQAGEIDLEALEQETVISLIDELRDIDHDVSYGAIDKLSEKDPSVIPDLIDVLENSYELEDVRSSVATSIAGIGGPEAISAFKEVLQNENTEDELARYFAILGLSEIEPETPEEVRQIISIAIWYSLEQNEFNPDIRSHAVSTLGETDPQGPQAKKIISVLRNILLGDSDANVLPDSNVSVRHAAIGGIAAMGSPQETTGDLIALLGDSDAWIRSAAVNALGGTDPQDPLVKDVVSALEKILENPNEDEYEDKYVLSAAERAREKIRKALKESEEKEALAFSVDDINSSSPVETIVIVAVLFGLSYPVQAEESTDPDTEETFTVLEEVTTVNSGHQVVRYNTVINMSKKGPETIPDLIKDLKDPDKKVRGRAISALSSMEPDNSMSPDAREAVLAFTAEESANPDTKEAVSILDVVTWSSDKDIRRDAIITIGKIGGPEAVSFLAGLLDSPYRDVVAAVAFALGERGLEARGAVPALGAALEKSYKYPYNRPVAYGEVREFLHLIENVRFFIIEALEKIGGPQAIAILTLANSIHNFEEDDRDNTIETLVIMGPETIPNWIRDLRSPYEKVRSRAISALSSNGEDAKKAVLAFTSYESARTDLDAGEIISILEVITWSSDKDIRYDAIIRIGIIGGPEGVSFLAGLLDSPYRDVVVHVAFTLGEMGSEAREAAPALRAALEFSTKYKHNTPNVHMQPGGFQIKSEDVRKFIVEALGKVGSSADIPVLEEALKDPDEQVSNAAKEAIRNIEERIAEASSPIKSRSRLKSALIVAAIAGLLASPADAQHMSIGDGIGGKGTGGGGIVSRSFCENHCFDNSFGEP